MLAAIEKSYQFGRLDELMIASTAYSYSYVVLDPSIGLASGTVEVRPDGPNRARILYSTIYDAETTAEARAAGRDSRARLLFRLLTRMKAAAER